MRRAWYVSGLKLERDIFGIMSLISSNSFLFLVLNYFKKGTIINLKISSQTENTYNKVKFSMAIAHNISFQNL